MMAYGTKTMVTSMMSMWWSARHKSQPTKFVANVATSLDLISGRELLLDDGIGSNFGQIGAIAISAIGGRREVHALSGTG